MSNSVVCTLFEGKYHYGVAALINSLYKNGFEGTFYIGYRGALPAWANAAKHNSKIYWPGNLCLDIAAGITLVFIPITTSYHFTNYKPDFMLQLLNTVAKDADAIFYFDPDIVIKCEWKFFKKWVSYGVAVVHENLYNDLPSTHPFRKVWAEIAERNNNKIVRQLHAYISGGFCAVKTTQIKFLESWSAFLKIGETQYQVDLSKFNGYGRLDPFCYPDQDALNIALSCYEGEICEMGPDAMDFTPGGFIMSHAVGHPKPWNKNFMLHVLKANPPSRPEKEFWKNVQYPIAVFSSGMIRFKLLSLHAAAFIGRFYNRH